MNNALRHEASEAQVSITLHENKLIPVIPKMASEASEIQDASVLAGKCTICNDEAAHDSQWGAFCDKCWHLFGFELANKKGIVAA
jgi:hypothetical protein